MTRRSRSITLIGVLTALGTTTPAAAQEGVFVDPDSSAAKEYAIPLDAARRVASGSRTKPGPAGPAPRFGEGLGEEDAGLTSGANGAGGSGSGTSGTAKGSVSLTDKRATKSSEREGSSVAGEQLRPGAPEGGGSGSAAVVLGGSTVLLVLGAGAGYALRRRGTAA